MKVTSNGQVSIPAATRNRWHTDRVVVVDLGDRVVMRPAGDDPIGELTGKYASAGPSTDDARRRARNADTAAERRKTR
jgi:bifunctional DNA-binding transcriptional regulator/antitoxin component of YhaV-PrlF toxin-antitoxin module